MKWCQNILLAVVILLHVTLVSFFEIAWVSFVDIHAVVSIVVSVCIVQCYG